MFLLSLPDSSSFFRITWSTLTLIFLELRWPDMNACIIAATFDLSGALIGPCKQKHLRWSVRPLSQWFRKGKKKKRYELVASARLYFLFSKQETTDLWVDLSGVMVSITNEKQPNNSRVTICQSCELTGTVFLCLCTPFSFFPPLCFTSLSHTSQISKCCFFFFLCTSQSVTSGKKKKTRKRNLTKTWFMLVPACFCFCLWGGYA